MKIYKSKPPIITHEDDRPETNGEFDFLSKILKNKNVVFDVGANVGNWSKKALSIASDISLYSFEPIPNIFSELIKNVPTAKCFNVAASDMVGEKEFFDYGKTSMFFSQLSTFYRRNNNIEKQLNMVSRTIKVKTETIDNFIKVNKIKKIDYLKVDTEGGELDVVNGAIETIKKGKAKVVQLEYGGCYFDAGIKFKSIYDIFINANYTLYMLAPDGLWEILEWNEKMEDYRYSNIIAVYKSTYH
jgi:FkbM family methyltransferase